MLVCAEAVFAEASLAMPDYPTLAAVDLGSNTFHLQVARVAGEQIYPLDALREPVKLGVGLGENSFGAD